MTKFNNLERHCKIPFLFVRQLNLVFYVSEGYLPLSLRADNKELEQQL